MVLFNLQNYSATESDIGVINNFTILNSELHLQKWNLIPDLHKIVNMESMISLL